MPSHNAVSTIVFYRSHGTLCQALLAINCNQNTVELKIQQLKNFTIWDWWKIHRDPPTTSQETFTTPTLIC